jgi:hypothetical protein
VVPHSCDGSDEAAGRCPDKCAAWAAAAAAARAAQDAAWAVGRGQFAAYQARGVALLAERVAAKDAAALTLAAAEEADRAAEARKDALLAAEKAEQAAQKAAAEAAVARSLDWSLLPGGAAPRLRLLLCFAAANNDTGVEALMRVAGDRLDGKVREWCGWLGVCVWLFNEGGGGDSFDDILFNEPTPQVPTALSFKTYLQASNPACVCALYLR